MSMDPHRVYSSASGLARGRPGEVHLGGALLGRERAAGEVAVAAPPGAACGRPARTAHVDRQVGDPEGLGEAAQVREGEELPVEADALGAAGPQQAQHVDRLVRAAAARGEVDPDRRGLPGQGPQPHGQQPHPPPGQHVDGRQPLREDHRMVVRQQQHPRPEQDAVGRRGDEGQAVERVGVRQRRRDLMGAGPRTGVHRDVLRNVQRLEPALLGVPREGGDPVRIDAEEGRAVADRESHRHGSGGRRAPSPTAAGVVTGGARRSPVRGGRRADRGHARPCRRRQHKAAGGGRHRAPARRGGDSVRTEPPTGIDRTAHPGADTR
jgi:hypothetical protein